MIHRRLALVTAVASLVGCSTCNKSENDLGTGDAAVARTNEITALLSPIAAQYGLPGLSAAVFDDNDIIALGATGVRKADDPSPVGSDDKWHLGSDTKAMTATLCALFVANGELASTTPLAEVFGAEGLHPDFRAVTLEQLLTHRGGLPGCWRRRCRGT
jgi:D-alanyl-D-alanine carboxypeptidase